MKRLMSLCLSIMVLFSLCLTMGMAAPTPASLKLGDRGTDVQKVQSRLRQWGYYNGAVDGIYGSGTRSAVILFQKRNGITADGIVGPNTARAIGITIGSSGSTTASRGGGSTGDVYLLAKLVYGEARGEPYAGQVAVAAVVLNRVASPKFPDTIAGVIYQAGAFTCVSDGQINLAPDDDAVRAARDAMNGWDPSGGAIYYYNPSTATSGWIWSRPVIAVIGRHRFAL